MFIPANLELYEVLPKEFYNLMYPKHGNRLWIMFDQRLLYTYHEMRKIYGTAILNTWYWGGNSQYRGWRPFDSDVGSDLSQHKFGRALDIIFKHHSAEQVRKDILRQPYGKAYKYIMAIEMNVGWVHIDTGNRLEQPNTETRIIRKVYP